MADGSGASVDPRTVRTRERVLAATVELVGEIGFEIGRAHV